MGRGTWSWIVLDGLWELARPLLPQERVRPQGGGTQNTPDETLFAAIIYVLVSGCAKATRRRRGKTDAIDAAAAAHAVLSGRASATAKTSDGPVETIRMFKMAKGSATKSRSQAINQLKAILVSADPALRESLTGLSNPKLIRRCSELEVEDGTGPAAAARHTLRLLARRIQHLTEEINDLTARITTAISACAPRLLERYGVGPDTAAALLITAGDNPERMGSEASFAALCGVSPVEASSGKTPSLPT